MMLINHCFTACVLLVGCHVYLSNCQNTSITPESDQVLPVSATYNVTYTCNVTGARTALLLMWEVQGLQFQAGHEIFEGIIIEELGANMSKIIVTSVARQMPEIEVRCLILVLTLPLLVLFTPYFYVRTYGQPLPPENLHLIPSEPIILAWDRPSNIPEGVEVNYTITVNSSSSAIIGVFSVLNISQVPIPFLDQQVVMESARCEAFQFYVMATVADVPESDLAVTMDTICTSAVQYAKVVFFENSISLTCLFASRFPAGGCVFLFQNETGTEEFIVLQATKGQRQCNESANHKDEYLSISAQDLGSDGVGRGDVVLPVDLIVMETEERFTDMTGCVPS